MHELTWEEVCLMTLNGPELGELLKLSKARISQLEADGVFFRRDDGKFGVVESARAYFLALATRGDAHD